MKAAQSRFSAMHPEVSRPSVSRRAMLAGGGVMFGAAVAVQVARAAEPTPVKPAVRYGLNTSTIRGQKLSLVEEVQIVAKAGYQAIEPWIFEIEQFVRQGGRLADLKKQIADLGLTVENTIGFGLWMSDEAEQSPKGWPAWNRDMELTAGIGAKRIAAPPTGTIATMEKDLRKVAARYRRLVELGRTFGVTPQLELWGRTKEMGARTLSNLGEIAYVLVESGDPDACALLDVCHLYTSGSPFAGLRMFNATALHTFHMNDYPADPPRGQITGGHRVYPGDGVAPLASILRDLWSIGFQGTLSLELFNAEYWKQDALAVARTGLSKMQAVAAKAAEATPVAERGHG